MKAPVLLVSLGTLIGCQASSSSEVELPIEPVAFIPAGELDLGNFSVSISVADIAESRAFYEKLGFRDPTSGAVGGPGFAILQNGHATIGLFEGFFEGNVLTFNPGWDRAASSIDPFTDVREIQRQLEESGIVLAERADPDSSGPAYVTLTDPDGNQILIDQHR